MKIILLPTNQKLKNKIAQFGNQWIVIEKSNNVICLNSGGFLIRPIQDTDNKNARWVRKEDISGI